MSARKDKPQEPTLEQSLLYEERAEAGLLGAIIEGGRLSFAEASEIVTDADFCDPRHQTIWAALRALDADGNEITLVSVHRFLQDGGGMARAGGVEHLAELPDIGVGPSFVSDFGPRVAELGRRRRLRAAVSKLTEQCSDMTQDVETLLARTESTLRGEPVKTIKALGPREASKLLVEDLEERFKNREQIQGVPTGWCRFDKMTDGLQHREMTLLAARPSIGKTAAALNVVEFACLRENIPTLVVSLEMRIGAMQRRLLSSYCTMPMGQLRSGQFEERDFVRFRGFVELLAKSPLHWIEELNGIDCQKLCGAIRRKVAQEGIKLVVVDYLQKIKATTRNEKRTYEVAEVSSALKACANETGAAFLVCAQLNRESERGGKEGSKPRGPRLSDLADSGQIERDADTVGLIHRDRDQTIGDASIFIAKQRDGELGPVSLSYDGRFCKFSNFEPNQS